MRRRSQDSLQSETRLIVDYSELPSCIFLKIRWIPAARHAQVAELTRILEEDELFQYPKEDDLIGPVRDPPALPRQ